jgi:hypothetical protein
MRGRVQGFFAAAAVAFAGQASATPLFMQGFETDTAGWTAGGSFGTITRVVDAATSFEGNAHAVVTDSSGGYGPYTFFGGPSDTFPGTYAARLAIHLDTEWDAGSGFDWSVASSGSDGLHQRDFIFHVTKDTSTGNLLVGGSNNTNFAPKENLESGNNYEVTTSGWYIFEHLFRNVGGVLAVDLNLYNEDNDLLFTETRSNPFDTIPDEVGGNRYGWFTDVTIDGGLKIDSTSLNTATPIPIPAPFVLLGGVVGALGFLKTRRRAA